MKKTHILFIICSIAIVGGVLLSIHENFENKANNWNTFTKVFQSIDFPPQEDILHSEILDVVGKPFRIKLEYTSTKSFDEDLESYKDILYKHGFQSHSNERGHFSTSDGLCHFYLSESKTGTHKMILSNGAW